jgi:hypothetical protein
VRYEGYLVCGMYGARALPVFLIGFRWPQMRFTVRARCPVLCLRDLLDAEITFSGSRVMQILTSSFGGTEGELLHVVLSFVLALNVDVDLLCSTEGNLCKEECAKHLLVQNLRAAGYNAAVCKSKWESSSRLLGGSHHPPLQCV